MFRALGTTHLLDGSPGGNGGGVWGVGNTVYSSYSYSVVLKVWDVFYQVQLAASAVGLLHEDRFVC